MNVRWLWVFLDVPEGDLERDVEFWRAVTRTTVSPWRGDQRQFATLLPAQGDPWVKVQRVGGPGGIHVDLDVDGLLEAARDEAGALGATVVHEWVDGADLEVVVCRSPGGFVFCLTQWSAKEHEVGQVRDGTESLLDQVCLDIPPSRYAAETAFWSALTGWAMEREVAPEFDRLEWPRQLPSRFLLQRLDEEGDGVVRGQADLACLDRAAEADRHVALGARLLGPGRGWTVLESPGGHRYCCTDRHPLTGGAASA